MEGPSTSHDQHCHNCGTALAGVYCYSCGQKKIEPSERTLKHFIFQFLGSAFFLENNFFKNIWYVLAHPGRQVVDIIEGRQKRWMPPFSLFLLINLFYFWYTPLSDMNLSLTEQLGQHHAPIAKKMVKERLEKRSITYEEYAAKYKAKSSGYSNSLIVLHVPLLAVVVMGLFYGRKYFFADYFVTCLYFLAFLLLMALIVVGLVEGTVALFPSTTETALKIFPIVLPLCMTTYAFIFLRNIFRQAWWLTGIKTVLFMVAFFFVHMIYRTILFFVIFWVT